MNKIVDEALNICIFEIKKEKNMKQIEEELLGPLIEYILEKIKPYILGMSIFLVTIILLIICVLFIILTSGSKK